MSVREYEMKQRRLWLWALLVVALVAAACGGSDDEADTSIDVVDDGTSDDGGDSSSDDDGGDADDTDADGDATEPDESPADEGDDAPDDDDAAEILGDPDLDLEELPDDVADMIDEIDDIVSIGDCQSDVLGIGFTAPDLWQCRVLDVSLGGIDGFTLFTEGNELNITVGTPSPIQVCEVLQACDSAEPVDLGAQWPGGQQFEIAGTTTIWARHATVDAEVVITKLSEITAEEYEFIRSVLDTTTEVG